MKINANDLCFMFILLFLNLPSSFWVQGFSLVFLVVVELFVFFFNQYLKLYMIQQEGSVLPWSG